MAILCTLSILATAHHLVKRCTQLTLCKDHVSDCCLDNIPVWLPGYKHSNTQKEKKFWPFLKWSHMSHAFLLVWWKTVRSGDSNGPSTSAASIRLMCLFADRNQWKCAKHLKKKDNLYPEDSWSSCIKLRLGCRGIMAVNEPSLCGVVIHEELSPRCGPKYYSAGFIQFIPKKWRCMHRFPVFLYCNVLCFCIFSPC